MTDINLSDTKAGSPISGQTLPMGYNENTLIELIELLFFAYRDFISDPDEILETYGFGRAHHRVIHFVARNPGIRVASLLDILRITKQSLGRVLRQLVEQEFVFQRTGSTDRRERRLYLTDKGEELARALIAPQLERIMKALDKLGPDSENFYREILYNLINESDQDNVRTLTKSNTGKK